MGSLVAKIGMSLLMQLMTEVFAKKVIISALEALVKKTESDVDDKLLAAVKESWGQN